ncbi:hypothetical protein MKW98_019905 [Papaver atlanticum]|uniref:Uncharacterized protein n=1 Tax=Papaver atlanticum TaxID=357466 RepID=A0AAD4S2H0_9MAGN|nr:hypothetical protein MKW98_019905 [Papaver atlanticum]
MASIHGLPYPHNRGRPEMSPEEEEEIMKNNLKLRAELIRTELMLRERATKAAGRDFKREDQKIRGYDWLLTPPRELQYCYMLIPREDSHCVASDPTKARASASQDETD